MKQMLPIASCLNINTLHCAKTKKLFALSLRHALLCTLSTTQRERHSPAEKDDGAVHGTEGREHQGQQQVFLFSVGILYYMIT